MAKYKKGFYYKGYTFNHAEFGWFGIPLREDCNKDRWGYTPNFKTPLELECYIDNLFNE